MLPLSGFLPHLLSSSECGFLKIHQVTVEQAGESRARLYTYGNQLAQAIPGTMVAKSESKETGTCEAFPLCEACVNPDLMSCS